jgi:ethanolamine-phosphate cytidylyltransferase
MCLATVFCIWLIKRGTYLIVGVHNDQVVNQLYGMGLPVLNLHERVLSILGCRYVDDVLIDAPYQITRDMITTLGIDEIVHVSIDEFGQNLHDDGAHTMPRYQIAIENGIFHSVQVNVPFRIENIIHRIQNDQSQLQAKYDRKKKAEQDYMLAVKDKLINTH